MTALSVKKHSQKASHQYHVLLLVNYKASKLSSISSLD